jgi:hypothetical protein
MFGKLLGFGRIHETIFLVFEIRFYFFEKFEENKVFCTGFVSYIVSLRPDIKNNW